jgi:hypothetical protein
MKKTPVKASLGPHFQPFTRLEWALLTGMAALCFIAWAYFCHISGSAKSGIGARKLKSAPVITIVTTLTPHPASATKVITAEGNIVRSF